MWLGFTSFYTVLCSYAWHPYPIYHSDTKVSMTLAEIKAVASCVHLNIAPVLLWWCCLAGLRIQARSGKRRGWLCSLHLASVPWQGPRAVSPSQGVRSVLSIRRAQVPWDVSLHSSCRRMLEHYFLGCILRWAFFCDFCAFAPSINKQIRSFVAPLIVLYAAWWT